ncbi:MAG: hypothetical protein Q8P40_01200 [Nitrospirota bacterium]|nr:hypothetical protein [Nitrospirota bacterium]
MKNVSLYMQRKDIISLSKKLILLLAVIVILMGCGSNLFEGMADKNSYEAKIEEARMALDDADYEKAKSILKGMDLKDPTVAQYLSNAYAGLAGLDTFNLLDTIDALTESDQTGSIDMVGKVLGDEDGKLTAGEIETKISYLNSAIDAMGNIQNLTDEQKVQLGLLSLNRAALTIADIISGDQINQGKSGDITLTEESLDNLYPTGTVDFSQEATPDRLNTLSTDITNVANSIDAILRITGQTTGEENDLANNFDEFSNAVDTDGNGDITTTELENYIKTL